MKKAWNDLKAFITVVVMLLLAYCVVLRIEIPSELKEVLLIVVSFFLGSKLNKGGGNDDNNS